MRNKLSVIGYKLKIFMKKFLGQHFLKNLAAIEQIISALNIQPNDWIIEIGPGKGALTTPLVAACQIMGAKLIAIEKDAGLVEQLRSLPTGQAGTTVKQFELINSSTVQLIHGDALKILPEVVTRYSLLTTNYKLVGNIPYYITGHLLRLIGELKQKPERVVLMIQKEVAERLTAKPPKTNLLSAATQFWAQPQLLFTLPATDFDPPPKVKSAVISLTQLSPDYYGLRTTPLRTPNYYSFIHAAFKQPRKTLANNLLAANPAKNRKEVEDLLIKLGFQPFVRAQNLSVEELIRLSREFPL